MTDQEREVLERIRLATASSRLNAGVQRQREDGSWGAAEPLGWQPGIDWEVYRPGWRGARWTAHAYEGPHGLGTVRARTRLGLALKIRLKTRRFRRGR